MCDIIFRLVVVPLLKLVSPAFFDRKYLQGKHFSGSIIGWHWVWRALWFQKILGFNRKVPWPVNPWIRISSPENLIFSPDDLNNFQSYGCYYQNFDAKIIIGSGTYIAPNVGFITANHDPTMLSRHTPGRDITIGKNCWIGMNAVILPGVVLGDETVVGAGAVVTKSFPEGKCTVVGVPAYVIKKR